jgi:hypothetical protein
MRMRFPLSEALRWYREKQDVVELTQPSLQAIDVTYERDVQPSMRHLIIIVFRCTGLIQPTYTGEVAPFVYYQFANEAEFITETAHSTDPIFDSTNILELKVTAGLKRYLDKETLEVVVFDDNSPVREAGRDVIGTAHVPLASLLLDTAIEG